MGAIIQNGNIGAIIQNGIVYGGTIVEGNAGIDYSTEEQDTGIKWIDGSSIYCITYVSQSWSNNIFITSDVADVIDMKAYCNTSYGGRSNYHFHGSAYNPNFSLCFCIDDSNNDLYIRPFLGSSETFIKIVVTVYYTKISTPPPTPSGADGLSYDIEIDGNWDMTVTEYNNGVQSNQETFDIDTVISTPATFGDLIITGTSSDDQYIVKPNSADGKSIKYNDVIYSGDTIIIQQPAYSTDTITGLLGWIE